MLLINAFTFEESYVSTLVIRNHNIVLSRGGIQLYTNMCDPLCYPLALAASALCVCQEQIYAMEWGMTSFEKTEVPRSAYLNNPATKNVVNPVDGEVVRVCSCV